MCASKPLAERKALAAAILEEFAASATRYLWTDALAVMSWLRLGAVETARRHIHAVHEALAPSGARDPLHPTARGLRIGKPLPERAPDEPYDAELEWERDGQYYHYLTKWMQALEEMARASSDERYRAWARELMVSAHRAFAHPADAPRRLYWKMSVDLSRPLVPSMGMHDALDGLVAAASLGLERETRDLERMCAGREWASADALGAGGLLLDALRLAQLGRHDFRTLLARVLEDAARSVEAVARSGAFKLPAAHRLAFRELGLALGLRGVEALGPHADVSRLNPFVPLAKALEDFWLDPAHQAQPSWTEHRDINAVTLAASLAA